MPIPEPKSNETKQEYLDRVIPIIYDKDTKKSKPKEERSKTAYAIAISKWNSKESES